MRPRIPQEVRGRFQWGRVSSVDKKRHTAQVKFFEGSDEWVSYDLQVLVPISGDYALPVADTPVLCVLIDGMQGDGYVLGALYTESDEAPLDDAGKRSIRGDDLRLGAHDAEKFVALASLVKDELDKIKSELSKIETTLTTGTSVSGGAVSFTTPYANGYSPTEPAAEKVKAK